VSTRSIIVFRSDACSHSKTVYYRHCDGYPTGVGLEIVEAFRKAKSGITDEQIVDFIARELEAEFYRHTTMKIDRMFPEIQADLEWIYEVCLGSHPSLTIYKTTNPFLEADFIWEVFSSYLSYMPENPEEVREELRMTERVSRNVLKALRSFERAVILKKPLQVTMA